jgi:hypothetical protein
MVTWGLVHGVAHCNGCGIDCMVYHYIEDENGKKQRVERTLQYHPNNYSINDEE